MKLDFYLKKKTKLFAQFKENLNIAKDLLLKKFDQNKVASLLNMMEEEYEKILPQAQYIGGNTNPFTSFITGAVEMFSMMRVLEKEGVTFREIGEFSFEYNEKSNEIREESLKKVGQTHSEQIFTPSYLKFMKETAKTSQERKFPGDWVFEFIDGKDEPFTYGYDFTQCGVNELAKRIGMEKYMPFMCLADFTEATAAGFGFIRTQTLGNGAPLCDHRYIKGGTTPRAWPPEKIQEFK